MYLQILDNLVLYSQSQEIQGFMQTTRCPFSDKIHISVSYHTNMWYNKDSKIQKGKSHGK